ncbi:MAG: ABC transporter permease, partial [Clostridiales bacterium]|nr:ABC transporter permease [Candidatus Equinaster intestinalis]
YDNTCGSGKVVMALASVIIGIAVFSKIRIFKDTTAVICGALVYSLCLNYIALVDKNGIYLKLLNAVLFAIILIFNNKVKSLTRSLSNRRKESGINA